AIHFEADVAAALVNQLPHLAQFAQGGGNEGLAAETGVHGHQQNDIELVHDVLEAVDRRGRVEYETTLAAEITDQLQGAVDVVGSLGMEGDVRGTGLGEIADQAVDRRDHQVHVDGCRDAVLAQRLADHRADGEIGDVVVVHDVEMYHVSTGREHS